MTYPVKFGDIWSLGAHKLLCGDSSKAEMVDELIGEAEIRLMIADPPYGVQYDSSQRHRTKKSNLREIKIRNDHRTNWSQTFQLSGAQVAYVWCPSNAFDTAIQALRDGNYDTRQQIVWLKPHFTLGRSAYHWQHETCVYAVRFGCTANWKGGRKQTTIWPEPIPTKRIHPTQKPVGLYTRAILNHTAEGERVFDPFAGSGVLFTACEQTGRVGYGVDLEPYYVAKTLERFESETGIKPTLVRNVFDKFEAKAA